MKICAIGDPHGNLGKINKIPLKVDVILLTGDIGKADLKRDIWLTKKLKPTKSLIKKAYIETQKSTIKILKHFSKFARVFIVFGNVDKEDKEIKRHAKEFEVKLPLINSELKKIKNLSIINNKTIKFKHLNIFGLRYFTDLDWAKRFEKYDKEILKKAKKQTSSVKKVLDSINKVDVLLCHQPPYGVLDKVTAKFAPESWKGKHAGSKVILDYIKKKQPRYVFCGHIHEGEGMKKIGKTEVYNLGEAGYKIIDFDTTF